MKKILFSILALGMTAGMSAQTADLSNLVDVTPTAFHFYKNASVDLESILLTDVTSPNAPNMGDVSFILKNSDIFSPTQLGYGSIVFGGGYKDKQSELAKGFSCYDFGGEIGNVLILNGAQSELADAIKKSLDLEAAPAIAKMDANYSGNINNFFLMDYYTMRDKMSEEDQVLIHFEYSAYNNDMSASNNVVEAIYPMSDQGKFITLNANITFAEFAVDGEWSPEHWMVVEAVVPYYEAPEYIRQFVTNNAALNTGALLIRDYAFYGVPADVDLGLSSGLNKTFVEYSLTAAPEPEIPTLYLVGSDVDGEAWALGTNQMTYADGVYTWTGEYLGNGFKINNGTWDAEYNIGAPENGGGLSLGVPYVVVAAESSDNIYLAGAYIGVENPKVVYDPVASTVTVTGEGVEQATEGAILYVRGDMNSWGTDDQMVESNGIYTYKFENVAEGQAKFKIADANWGKNNYGGPAMDVYSNNPGVQKLVYNGENIEITNWVGGPMVITFNLSSLELTVEGANQPVDGSVGINGIGSDNEVVEYYNLQGVKVANPEKGIFIKKQGNKTVKVIR